MTTKTFTTETHALLDGQVKLKRTRQSNKVWQFEMWISDEGKYVRKSLRTENLEVAKSKAEEMFIHIRSQQQRSVKIFSPSWQQLVDSYIEKRESDVELGSIVIGRVVTIKSQCKHILDYIGRDTKTSALQRNDFMGYARTRKSKNKSVKMVTIRNEQSTINAIVKWGYENGLCHLPKVSVTKIEKKQWERQGESIRRSTFTPKQYKDLYTLLRSYVAKNTKLDEHDLFQRQLIRHYILILANTCMRTGELYNLKWEQVATEIHKDETGKDVSLVRITVLQDTTKVKSERTFVARGGQYFDRLRELSKHTNASNYVFTTYNGDRLTKRALYWHWQVLMEQLNIDYKNENIKYYSLRHFGITERIRAGSSYSTLAKMCGTSVKQIENTYSHVNCDDMALEALIRRKPTQYFESVFTRLEEK